MDRSAAHQTLLRERGVRKAQGAYYTPAWIVERLLQRSLERKLDEVQDPFNLRIVDPACGGGAFLLGAAKFLLARYPGSQREIGKMLTGIDIDSEALAIARLELGALGIEPSLVHADFLTGDWPCADLWIGNPPFRNAIERSEPSVTLSLFSELGGTADLAYQFVAKAARFLRPQGQIAMVLPRAFLSAPSASKLRSSLVPQSIDCLSESKAFEGAAVFVSLVVMGLEPGPTSLHRDGEDSSVARRTENWWSLFFPEVEDSGFELGERFEVAAGLTASEAYELRPYIAEGGPGQRFVTTGLIDPDRLLWGEVKARVLGKDYRRPTIGSAGLPPNLERRRLRSLRPKVLVAGLSKRVEAVLDADGAYMGAVSTFSLFDPLDDCANLADLCKRLNAESASLALNRELGANALGGGSITLTQRFLRSLRLRPAEEL